MGRKKGAGMWRLRSERLQFFCVPRGMQDRENEKDCVPVCVRFSISYCVSRLSSLLWESSSRASTYFGHCPRRSDPSSQPIKSEIRRLIYLRLLTFTSSIFSLASGDLFARTMNCPCLTRIISQLPVRSLLRWSRACGCIKYRPIPRCQTDADGRAFSRRLLLTITTG
jgi:hypothetical protein